MQQTATPGGANPPTNMVNMSAGMGGAVAGMGNGGPQDPNAMAAAMSVMASAQAAQGGVAGGMGTMPNQAAPGGMAGGAVGNFYNPAFAAQQSQEHNAAAAAAHAAAAMAERNLSTAASRNMGGNGRNSWVQVDGNNALPGTSMPDGASNPAGNATAFQATSAEAALMMNQQQQQQQQQRLMEQIRQQQAGFATGTGATTDSASQIPANPYGQQFNPAMQTPQTQAGAGGATSDMNGYNPLQAYQQTQQQLTANMHPYTNPNAALLQSFQSAPTATAGVPPASYSPLAMLGLNIPPQHMTTANAFGLAGASLPQPPISSASKKKAQRKKNKYKPKRPLSAYNLFFKDERAKILKGIPDGDTKDDTKGQPQFANDVKKEDEDKNEVSSHGANDDDNGDENGPKEGESDDANVNSQAKKQKVPHGKIGFENLAKLIGKRWQNLESKRVEHYKALADKDMKRYKEEMEAFLTKQEMDLAKEKKELQESKDGDNDRSVSSSGKSNKRKAPDSTNKSNGMMPATAMPMVAPGGVGMGPGFELFGVNNLQQMKDHWQQQQLQLQLQQNNVQQQQYNAMGAGELVANEVALEKQRRLDGQTKQAKIESSSSP